MKKAEVPAMRLIRLEEDMAKYKPPQADLDVDSIRSFVQSFLDGKLKVSFSSFSLIMPSALVYHYP
jgi:protein disulfide-isomerase A1